jgi:hypothetical protein
VVSPSLVEEFWTDADGAELDVLVFALVNGVFDHRELCALCRANEAPCPHVQKAIAVVVEWRDARALLSKAEALREARRRLEDERELVA